jgi:hypothetical protein
MSRQREFIVAGLVAGSILLAWSVPSSALGPDPAKGGVSSPIGSNAATPTPPGPAQGVAPKGTLPPQGAAPPAPGKSAALPAEPKWPQNFALGVGERTGFGFAVGQPGPIVVTVKWQGAPLAVILTKPGRGGAVERQGSGVVTIKYTATALDVRKGVLWGVGLRAAQEGTNPSTAAGRRYQVLANGTVSVQHPPGNMNLAQAELKALAEQAGVTKLGPPPAAPQVNAAAQKEAALQKQQAARQAQLLEQIRPKIPAEVFRKMSVGPAPGLGTETGSGTTRPGDDSAPVRSDRRSVLQSKGPRTAVEVPGMTIGPVVPGVSSTQSGQTGAAGSTQPNTVASPAITSLSISEGQKGDAVLVSGTDFSNTPGEVRFANASNPQQDLPAQVLYWNDREVLVTVPDVSQVTGSSGLVYVRRANMPSNKVPFRFTETRVLDHATTDRYVAAPYTTGVTVCHPACSYGFNLEYLTFGNSKDDEYYRNTTLRNGWVVESAHLAHVDWPLVDGRYTPVEVIGPSGTANANSYITDSRPGTSSPYVKVHWWYDAGNSTGYALRVIIRGPKGVPHQ